MDRKTMKSNLQRATLFEVLVLPGKHYKPSADGLTDLLADAMHWAEVQGVSFDECLRVANDHFDQERKGET